MPSPPFPDSASPTPSQIHQQHSLYRQVSPFATAAARSPSSSHRTSKDIPAPLRSHVSDPIKQQDLDESSLRDNHIMAVSTANAPGSLRLPSFAELNERLSFPEGGSFSSPSSRSRLQGLSAGPSTFQYRRSSAVHYSYSHDPSQNEEEVTAFSTPPSNRGGYEVGRQRSSQMNQQPVGVATPGLTASWLPIEDPGRSAATRSSLRSDTGLIPARRGM